MTPHHASPFRTSAANSRQEERKRSLSAVTYDLAALKIRKPGFEFSFDHK